MFDSFRAGNEIVALIKRFSVREKKQVKQLHSVSSLAKDVRKSRSRATPEIQAICTRRQFFQQRLAQFHQEATISPIIRIVLVLTIIRVFLFAGQPLLRGQINGLTCPAVHISQAVCNHKKKCGECFAHDATVPCIGTTRRVWAAIVHNCSELFNHFHKSKRLDAQTDRAGWVDVEHRNGDQQGPGSEQR